MKVAAQFFSQLREIAGAADETVEMREGASVQDLLEALYRLHPGLEKWDRQILLGSGVEFVERDHLLSPNEEIAIMPPVQGG